MNKLTASLIGLASLITVPTAADAGPRYEYVSIGGVNLNSYCSKTFGGGFKSVLIGSTAGDWTCERSAGDRRPISVENACRLQYGKTGLKAKALDWSDPGSWRCMEAQRRLEYRGVNLNNYCVSSFGGGFKSVLIGATAGDWTCERSAGDRRPISVKTACVMQYGHGVIEAKALNWSDPLSWRCVL